MEELCYPDVGQPVVQGSVEGGVVTDGETEEEDITGEQGGAGGQGLQGAGGGGCQAPLSGYWRKEAG